MCQDSDGNTGMHLLIPFYNSNKEIVNILNKILLNNDCEDFINIQNNQGKTKTRHPVPKYRLRSLRPNLDQWSRDSSTQRLI